ncbi:MAG: zf-HC2 domain-containing protein [Kofleriaceae bacterium]
MSHLDDNTVALLVDGGLPDDRRAEVEAHLDACAQCAEWLASLGGLLAPMSILQWAAGKTRDELDTQWLAAVATHPLPTEQRFLAPEVLRGEASTERSELFTSAAAWWEARHGTPPFRGATPGALLVSITAGPELPADADRVTRVLVRALAVDPARRVPDLADAMRLARPSFVSRLWDSIARRVTRHGTASRPPNRTK